MQELTYKYNLTLRLLQSRLQHIYQGPEPVFLNVYGAQKSIPRNEFPQPM